MGSLGKSTPKIAPESLYFVSLEVEAVLYLFALQYYDIIILQRYFSPKVGYECLQI